MSWWAGSRDNVRDAVSPAPYLISCDHTPNSYNYMCIIQGLQRILLDSFCLTNKRRQRVPIL